jgi:phage-related tail protein
MNKEEVEKYVAEKLLALEKQRKFAEDNLTKKMKHYLLEDLMEKVLKMNDEVEERTTRVANNLTREISTMKESLEETEDLKANFKHIVNMCERKLDAASLESIYDALKMMVTKD